MLNFDPFTVKYGTRNIQNDCHQQLSSNIRVHKISAGAPPGPHWGAYSAPPDSLRGLRGTNSKAEGGGEGER